jgi:starch phosphorylase
MKEFSEPNSINMQPAPGLEPVSNTRTDFTLNREMPASLKALDTISANFFWSWNPDGRSLFRDLDPTLWDKCEQNPRLFLKLIGELRLWQFAADDHYVERVLRFSEKQDQYLSEKSYTPSGEGRPTPENPVAYFCAEYGVHNSLPNYSGGLGILAGDHLKSASDLNLPLKAIGLLYRYGYFRQRFAHDGVDPGR